MDKQLMTYYHNRYGEIGAAALSVIESSLVTLGNQSLREEGFNGKVNVSFDIDSYDAQKGKLSLIRGLEKIRKKK